MKIRVNKFLVAAGVLSIAAALAHLLIIFGGPDWYRFFGAGEKLAQMAERGETYPMIVTLFIAAVLTAWGLYAFSGAKLIVRLPLVRLALVLITATYCIRGVYGFFMPLVSQHPYVQNLGIGFWVWSSGICLVIGLIHLFGLRASWQYLSKSSV